MLKFIRLSIVAFCLLFATSVLAQGWWSANANITVSNTQIAGSVYNGFARPTYCVGRVIGTTYYGMTIWSAFDAVINPGYTAYAYVYTNQQDPFVGGDANIQCRWY